MSRAAPGIVYACLTGALLAVGGCKSTAPEYPAVRPARASLSGRVVDGQGAPVAGLRVVMQRGTSSARARSDDGGRFAFDDPPTGLVVVAGYDGRGAGFHHAVWIHAGEARELAWRAPDGHSVYCVRDQGGTRHWIVTRVDLATGEEVQIFDPFAFASLRRRPCVAERQVKRMPGRRTPRRPIGPRSVVPSSRRFVVPFVPSLLSSSAPPAPGRRAWPPPP